MASDTRQIHVSLVATADAQVSPLSGLYETLTSFELLARFEPEVPRTPFAVDIVAGDDAAATGASGLPLGAHRSYGEVERTDVVIVPLMMMSGVEWSCGRTPGLVNWIRQMHAAGAQLCSACTGVLLLAETGLLAGREATLHWAFAPTFRRNFPDVRLRVDEAVVVAGERGEFLMTGGVTSWHDLALRLIARYVGPMAASSMARLLMLQWHAEGQAPYLVFSPAREHGDALVLGLQEWLDQNLAAAIPVEKMTAMSGISRRSLERRFRKATGSTPLAYVQALRVEEAKRQLERTDLPVDEIGFAVGYENSAFFRRLFKRATRLTPAAYRRRFGVAGVADSSSRFKGPDGDEVAATQFPE